MVYSFLAGEQVTAANLNAIFAQQWIRKAATETVTSSVALQNDNDFDVSLEAGDYLVWVWLHVSGVEAGDIRVAWTNTGSMTIARSCFGADVSTTDRENTNAVLRGNSVGTEQVYGIDTTGATIVMEHLMVVVDAAGDLTMQWAQGTSNGTGTSLSTASRMWIVNVG